MFKAYTGIRPYAFLSYSHKDIEKVFPLMERLQQVGCNIWYDEGIHPADEWADTIAKKLTGAQVVLLMLSKNSINSQNVKREIYYAVSKEIDIIPFYIDDVALPEGLELQLGIFQAIRSNNPQDDFTALKSSFPPEAISGWEPKLLYSCRLYNYYFCVDSIKGFSIIKHCNETGESIALFKNEQPSYAEIESSFECYSLRYAYNNDFHPFNEDTLLFNVFCDHVSDRYVPRFYVDYHFSIVNPGSESPSLKFLKCMVKNYAATSRDLAETKVYNESNLPTSWKNQI